MDDAARREDDGIRGGVGAAQAHDSARMHVCGSARYTDDIPEPRDLLHVWCVTSPHAHARLGAADLAAVRAAPGVVDAVSAADIPGSNDIGPMVAGEPILAEGIVEYVGQPVVAIAATSVKAARAAAALARIDYDVLPAVLTVDEAFARRMFVSPPTTFRRGNAAAALEHAPHRLSGMFRVGGQDHFYLEGQIAMALPQEGGAMLVHSSTQHPSEVQKMVARVLDLPYNAVTVEVRRMGGGFGGKETQPAMFAAIAALIAQRTRRPVKYRLDRDDDMTITGKRHDFLVRWQVGFDEDGRITALDMDLAARAGHAADLSPAIVDRALFHADNCYYIPDVELRGFACKTHTQSNTAFRGFGGPQGMIAIEEVVDTIARHLGRDPLEIRRRNFYGVAERNITPYHMVVEDNIIARLVDDLERSSDYAARRAAVADFNRANPLLRKGLALTPVKFGISFTATFYNQAGALLHVYTDGSVHLNHGGTEMGQGLFTKVAQIVADELNIDLDRICVSATNTGKVPNTSATAASAGTDLNGMAAQAAARMIVERLTAFASAHFSVPREAIRFKRNAVEIGERTMSFAELVALAYRMRVQLSATGFYKTPKIHWDRDKARGRPFLYFAYGAAVAEVIVDTLTGEYKVLRADLLHDVGRSINPAIDLGQVEGGFVQGMGWLTTEELWFDAKGRLATHAPSTYKIPVASDLPRDFRVRLLEGAENPEATVHRSKAVGEPPLMLANAVFFALKDAVAAAAGAPPSLDAPATPERVLLAIEDARGRAGQ